MSNLISSVENDHASLRVVFVAGTLGQGGAERQLYYNLRTLHTEGIEVLLVCLTENEYWQKPIELLGIKVTWVGQNSSPLLRLVRIISIGYKFSPDIIQSQHFFTNLYVAIAARLMGVIDIGAIRSNVKHELECNKFWGKALLYLPRWICANSYYATNILAGFRDESTLLTLPNAIDLEQFDQSARQPVAISISKPDIITIITVARLIPAKRLDRFLEVANLIHSEKRYLQFIIVGDGPERWRLESRLVELGLTSDFVRFLGNRSDVPQLLSQSDLFLFTSDDEGFPNVLLEAMAASLPIITTPAGDSSRVVVDGTTGYVVDFSDIQKMAEYVLLLMREPDLRARFGKEARKIVEKNYSVDGLRHRLLKLYSYVLKRDLINRF